METYFVDWKQVTTLLPTALTLCSPRVVISADGCNCANVE